MALYYIPGSRTFQDYMTFIFFPDLLISSRISVKQTKDESIASKLVSELLGKKIGKNLWRPPEAHGLLNPLETPQVSPIKANDVSKLGTLQTPEAVDWKSLVLMHTQVSCCFVLQIAHLINGLMAVFFLKKSSFGATGLHPSSSGFCRLEGKVVHEVRCRRTFLLGFRRCLFWGQDRGFKAQSKVRCLDFESDS